MEHPRITLFFILLSTLCNVFTAGSQTPDPKPDHKLLHLEVIPTFSILYSHGYKLEEEEPFNQSADSRQLKPVFSYSIGINSTIIDLGQVRFGIGLMYLKTKLNFVQEQDPNSNVVSQYTEIMRTQSRFKAPIYARLELGNFGGFIKLGVAYNHLISATFKGKPSGVIAGRDFQVITNSSLENESPSINKNLLSAEISLGLKRNWNKRSLYFDLGYSYDLANNSNYKSSWGTSTSWSPSGYYPSFKTGIINLGLGFGF